MPALRKVLFVMACPPGVAGQSGDLAVPPAGMLAIAGYCRQFYPQVEFALRDFGAEKISLEEQVEAVRRLDPDVVGMAARSFIYPATVRLAAAIRAACPRARIVFGGQHPTLMPADTAYPDCFDCVVRGEGEAAFLDLLQRLERGEAWPRVLDAPYLDDLGHDYAWDIISAPDRYVRPMSPFYPQAMGSVVWSRGCPFDCFFCSGPALWSGSKPRVRYRSANSICNELEYIGTHYGVRRMFIHDDTLNANVHRLKDICEEIIARGIRVRWASAGMRANESLTPEWLFPLLYKAGCRMVSFGIESGDPQVLQRINRRVSLDETERALGLCKKYGIRTGAGFTMGHIWLEEDGALGGESEEQLARTVEYMRSLVRRRLLWSVVVAVIDPVPGSRLWDAAKVHGLLHSEDLEDILSYDRVRLNFRHPRLDPATIEKYYLKAYRLFSLNPAHALYMLSCCRSLDDLIGVFRVGWYVLKNRSFSWLKQRYLRSLASRSAHVEQAAHGDPSAPCTGDGAKPGAAGS